MGPIKAVMWCFWRVACWDSGRPYPATKSPDSGENGRLVRFLGASLRIEIRFRKAEGPKQPVAEDKRLLVARQPRGQFAPAHDRELPRTFPVSEHPA